MKEVRLGKKRIAKEVSQGQMMNDSDVRVSVTILPACWRPCWKRRLLSKGLWGNHKEFMPFRPKEYSKDL